MGSNSSSLNGFSSHPAARSPRAAASASTCALITTIGTLTPSAANCRATCQPSRIGIRMSSRASRHRLQPGSGSHPLTQDSSLPRTLDVSRFTCLRTKDPAGDLFSRRHRRDDRLEDPRIRRIVPATAKSAWSGGHDEGIAFEPVKFLTQKCVTESDSGRGCLECGNDRIGRGCRTPICPLLRVLVVDDASHGRA